MLCDPKELSKLIYFHAENPDVVAERVSTEICSLNFNDLQNIATHAFKNINLNQILSTVCLLIASLQTFLQTLRRSKFC